ncbi:MAG: histidinol-phosphate transaminase [Bacillota bacterium]|nr:histidinol-phosphate transaminase [Bacillota bacterium]
MKKPLMRECLQLIKPYQPGKPVEEVERELGLKDVIKLASNENPLGPSAAAIEEMQQFVRKMHIYPDGNCFYLKQLLAEKIKIAPEQLVFGNGSDELLALLTLLYVSPGEEAVTVAPSFSEYDFSMRLMGGIPRAVPLVGENFAYDLDAVLNAVNEKTRIVFICSPNNPTGSIVYKEDLDRFVEKLPDNVLLVLDQAYIEYVDEPEHPTGLDYIEKGYPVIALRTFSKIYGLAGLRIGYGISTPEIIADLGRVREPFNVNAMAQAAARAALGDTKHLEQSRELVLKSRRQLADGFAELGLRAVPDQANFCFVDIKVDSKQAFQALLRKGVIVRTGDIFGHPTYIRVTYGTEEQNKRFLTALKEVLVELK